MAVPIAVRDQLPSKLVVAVPSARAQTHRILPRERIGDGLRACSIEVLLPGLAEAQGGVERVQDGRLACVERLGPLPLLLKSDHHLIRIRVRDITDWLDNALAQPLRHPPPATPVNPSITTTPHLPT